MYSLGLTTMPIPAMIGSAVAAAALRRSGEDYWLYGGVALFSVLPYTFLAIMPTNKQLQGLLDESEKRALAGEEEERAVEGMKRWVKLHRVRALLALAAAGLFFVAGQLTKAKTQ